MKVTFTESDFKDFRKFQNAMNRKFGDSAYVGTDHACVLVEFSPELKAMTRPELHELNYEYEVRFLVCEDCKKTQAFLCAKDETTYVCWDCGTKRIKKRNEESRKAKEAK